MSDTLVNFLHVGPGKTGSTWLHEVLIRHPEVYLTEAKDLYFFSRCYDRGLGWYQAQFHGARPEHKIVGEISPDYLACDKAPERIRECLGPDVRFMVTLREPAERAFSAYLHMRKHGLAEPSFRLTAEAYPELMIEENRYATQLRRYTSTFGRDAVHVAVFDDLQADPQAFVDGVTGMLGIAPRAIDPELLKARLPASKARWLPAAAFANRGADWLRRNDHAEFLGRVKRLKLVHSALYKPLGVDRPVMSPEDVAFVREQLGSEVAEVEEEFGIPLRQRWGWN
jgi:hypothetical protein